MRYKIEFEIDTENTSEETREWITDAVIENLETNEKIQEVRVTEI